MSDAQAGSVIMSQALLPQMIVCGKDVDFFAVNKSQHLIKSSEKVFWPPASLQFNGKINVLVKQAFS